MQSKPLWYESESSLLDLKLYPDMGRIADSINIPAQSALRSAPNRAFGVGEQLVFQVQFGFLSAGVGILEIPEIVEFRGTRCYRIVSKAISNNFVTTFYPVRDIIVSLFDTEGLYPVLFEKHLREGGYRRSYWILFDQKNNTAFWQDTTFSVGAFSQDIISVMYYARTLDARPGQTILVNSHTDKKNYPLAIRFLGHETIAIEGTKYRCVVVEPVLQGEGLFKQKGSLKVWMTDDERRIPVRMKSKIYAIGSITATLISYRNGMLAQEGSVPEKRKDSPAVP